MTTTVAIVQARTGSARLPGKTLARLLGRPLLDVMLERVERARSLDGIVLATTELARDDELAEIAAGRGVTVFRGSEADVLGRYASAAALARAGTVVRLTADCPLIDPAVIDRLVAAQRAIGDRADLVTNTPPRGRTYPDGMDVEVVQARTLARIDRMSDTCADDREHVTRRLQRPPFRYRVVDLDPPAGDVRITVDHPRDLELVRTIFADLYPRNPDFGLDDVLAWLGRSPAGAGRDPARARAVSASPARRSLRSSPNSSES